MAENREKPKIKEQIFEDYRKTVENGADIFTESTKKLNSKIESSISSVEKTLGKLGDGVIEKNKKLSKAYDEYKKVFDGFQDVDGKTIKGINELTKNIENLSESLSKSSKKIAGAEKAKANFESQIKVNDVEFANKGNLIESKLQTIIQLKEKIKELDDKDIDDLDEIEKRTNEISQLEQDILDVENEIGVLNKEREELSKSNLDIINKIRHIDENISNLNEEINKTKSEINEQEKERLDLLEKAQNLEEQITEETERQVEATERVNKAKQAGIKLAKVALGLAKEFFEKWVEIDNAVTKHNRTVGISHAQSEAYRKNVLKNYGEMATRLGMTFEEMYKFQEQYAKNTGRATILTNKQVETLAGLSKITSEVATEEMVKNMDSLGASIDSVSGYLAQSYARASQNGLNAAKTSEALANNVKMASKYTFREGVNGISKMTMMSERLKFNMESMSGVLDKFSSIEGAIETSASLQILGGAYANNFGNPLEAMSMALMDAEGMTEKLVDTFSSFATFDREKGMADMSAFEKLRMKEAANALGISYDEVWNIAAQNAKAQEIDREIGAKGLNQANQEFLRNKAQYDLEKKQFYVNYYDEKGNEQQKYLNEVLSDDIVSAIRQNNTKEEILQNDVHTIMTDLQRYVKATVGESKSGEETAKGAIEQYLIGGARIEDGALTWAKNKGQDITNQGKGGGLYGLGHIGTAVIGGLGLKGLGNLFGGVGGGAVPSATGNPTNWMGKINPTALKIGGYGWAAVQIGHDAIGAINAKKKYNNQLEEINNSDLGYYEKKQAAYSAKQEQNKSYGKIAGSTTGAIIGGVIGSLIAPGVGTAIGAGIGSSLGSLSGGAIGKAVTKNNVSSAITNNSSVSAQQVVGNQTHINNNLANGMGNCKITIEPMKIDLSGVLKLKGENGSSKDIDVNKLMANHDFVSQIKDMISNEINKEVGERINKHTPYYGKGASQIKYS